MSDANPRHSGLGLLALVALVACCAAPLLISAGMLAAVGAWLCNAFVIALAAATAAVAVVYALYRRRNAPH